MAYRRMDLNVGAMISEVEARPALWDKSCSGYTDRHRRSTAWTQICKALYPHWSGFTQTKQGVIERDIKNRWKTVRDRFFKSLRTHERSGGSPYCQPKCPFFEELLFLLPSRSLRPSERNYRVREGLEQAPAVLEDQQQWKRESSPTPISEYIVETDGEQEHAGSSRMATSPSVWTEETPSVAATRTGSPAARSTPPTRRSSSRAYSRRSHRATDRHMEVENETLSLIRRVDADDDCDFFGYGIAARCRQMRSHVRNEFMSYVYAAAAVFDSANPLPELGDLINHLRSITGLRDPSPPPIVKLEVVSTSSQTYPVNFADPPLPTSGS